ncbi:hypothetical protein [Lutibacter sp.]|uniref:hypothetical protein n=1 Tax=Lutibacter sp. TaxID=1925666 RepID=UPI0027362438|nr:hypothetical protein [Lutibacter sp.]MDP3313755.1 hypothetical protein [Lutibacter sp.]
MSKFKNLPWGKWLILSIGIIFTVYGIFLLTLTFFGTDIEAKVTSYRREYGERNEMFRNQYTYLYGYEFYIDSVKYSGTGQNISDSVYLKNDGNSFMHVKYLSCCPYINSDFEGSKTTINLIISLVVGIGLVLVSRKM